MSTFLHNLPSFNKENFSNFQPDLNSCLPLKKQSFMASTREYPDEHIIVNQNCNLIIQYLEKTNRDQFITAINLKAKKRDINQVMQVSEFENAHDTSNDEGTAAGGSDQHLKKKRLEQEQHGHSSSNTNESNIDNPTSTSTMN